jgi:hypothetical protein
MSSEVEPLFEESGGLAIFADLSVVSGTSPVSVTVRGDRVTLELGVSAGSVSAELQPERASDLAAALERGAAEAAMGAEQ